MLSDGRLDFGANREFENCRDGRMRQHDAGVGFSVTMGERIDGNDGRDTGIGDDDTRTAI